MQYKNQNCAYNLNEKEINENQGQDLCVSVQ